MDRADERTQEEARAERAELSVWHDDDGMTRLRAAVVPEDGAVLEAAIASARERLEAAAATSSVSTETPVSTSYSGLNFPR